jgi:hypothetical protein
MKRVLIIAYYWPPAGGPGVQRWLHMVAHLPSFGIEPIVCVPANPHYPTLDGGLLVQVPDEVEVIRRPIYEPYGLAALFSPGKTKRISRGVISEKETSWLERVLLSIRGNLFIPDARIGWVRPMSRYWKKHYREMGIDAIVTTGPPHSLHLIGMKLKTATGLPWLADFRDPWTEIHYHRQLNLSKRASDKHKRLESEVLRSADHITVTSPSTARSFSQITERPVSVVTNGYDGRNWKDEVPDEHFSIVHIGSLYSNRNPLRLWEAVGELIRGNETIEKKLKLKFYGIVSEEVKTSILSAIPEANVDFHGYVDHVQALKYQRKARLLLLIEMDRLETRQIVPGKLFEYIQARRPIMALGPQDSDVQEIIGSGLFGSYFGYDDHQGITNALMTRFQAFLNGADDVKVADRSAYDRRELAKQMSDILKALK